MKNSTIQFFSNFLALLYNCIIIILIGLEPPAYFEDSRDFVDKQDYSLICYSTISADYTVHSVKWAPLAKEREHLNGFEWCGRLVRLFLYFASTTKIYLHFTQQVLYIETMCNKTIIGFGFVISGIIKVSASVISLGLRPRLITLASTFIIPDITKTSSNYYCL